MCVFRVSLQLLSDTFFILRIIERDMIKNVCWSLYKYPLFLLDFNETSFFLGKFYKNIQILSSMKICPVEAELFHFDGRAETEELGTDTTKLIVAFRNFANAPKTLLYSFMVTRSP